MGSGGGGGAARGLRHPTPTPASQRSHPARTKSHFPTNSLSEAAGQVINHRERERSGKGERLRAGRAGRAGGEAAGADGGPGGEGGPGRALGKETTRGKGGKEIAETKKGGSMRKGGVRKGREGRVTRGEREGGI